MPVRYQIDNVNRLVVATGHGMLTDQEVFEYKQSVWSLPAVAGYDELIDLRDVKHIEVPTAERLRELARLSAAMDVRIPSKVAIVSSDPVTAEVARTYQALRKLDPRSTRRVSVFPTVEQAAHWLRPAPRRRPRGQKPTERGRRPGGPGPTQGH
jgi:hypothetical protein